MQPQLWSATRLSHWQIWAPPCLSNAAFRSGGSRGFISLLLGNAQSVAEKGAVNALTGPIERGDAQTVSKHLQEIRKFAAESTVGQDILTAYTALSKQLIRIAQQKHPHKDYKHLEKELEQ